ncbi:uncharacterized protein LOC112451434 isoform X2 [Kryptolebias marmoratus]|uniref:uncharacterized protein LOC112451434 isoform X2 n=1 Tax=Kryptolebias marmoratus TaxID=37003 RepID=UPI000D52FEAA|nr:uncharacterized protein LOC112451434 isoform X2 [Kryptolebias marmoratus]
MEEFPKQTINLIHTDGSQEVKTTNDAISKIPVQFLLKVVPSIPSCTEGLYLPRFLPPTPDNRAQIYTVVGHPVEITIMAEATKSKITELLFSGPYNTFKSTLASGTFALKWTPSNRESGQSHSICFVVQASYSNNLYQSELRCVTVQICFAFFLNLILPTTMSLDANKEIIEKRIKDELIKRGLPAHISVGLLKNDSAQDATKAPPSG